MYSNKKQVSLYDKAFLDSLPSLTLSDYNDEIAEATRNAAIRPSVKKNTKIAYRKTPALNFAKKRNVKLNKVNEQLSKPNKQYYQNGKRVFFIKFFKINSSNQFDTNLTKKLADKQTNNKIQTEYKLRSYNSDRESILKIKLNEKIEGQEFLFIQKPSRPHHAQKYLVDKDLIIKKHEVKHR